MEVRRLRRLTEDEIQYAIEGYVEIEEIPEIEKDKDVPADEESEEESYVSGKSDFEVNKTSKKCTL